MAEDELYYWRWRNRVRIMNRAEEKLRDREIDARVLPTGFLLPLLEKAGDIENPELQEMWAQLLVSGIESDEHQHPSFATVLHQLSTSDAKVLQLVNEGVLKLSRPRPDPGRFTWSATVDLDLPKGHLKRDAELPLCIDHLVGVGLLEWQVGLYLNLTAFGAGFLAACTAPTFKSN